MGRIEYCHLGKKEWVEWENEHWKPILTYIPTISLLAKGWIVFMFMEEEHASVIRDSLWRIGKGSLVLGIWHVHFDPLRERVMKHHLWVLLPSLPFPLWSKGILEGIANTIGRFVSIEEDFHLIFDERMAKVLVGIDISSGLPAEIKILCK